MDLLKYQPLAWTLICGVELFFLLREQFVIELAPLPFLVISAYEITSWLYGTIVFYFISVMFGASPFALSTHIFAATMTGLVWIPAVAHLRRLNLLQPRSLLPLQFYFQLTGPRAVVWAGLAAMGGAYLGAAAIPLDWDRWWQQWPLPCLIGALAAFPLGYFVAFISDLLE